MTATQTSIATARAAARAAADKIAQDIVALDVSERLALADVFLIASAPSERQVNAIVDGIEEELASRTSVLFAARAAPADAGSCWTTPTS